jgi:hypothetical protein
MPMTEEQKQAARERMKAYHAAKKAEKEQATRLATEEKVVEPEVKTETQVYSQEDIDELKRQIAEVSNALKLVQQSQPLPQPTQNQSNIINGRIVGITDKYTVDPAAYPDPTERLSKEPRLQPHAFEINYELEYVFGTSQYETIDKIWMKEPKLELSLSRKILNEMGEDTNGRYLISTAVFFEDPQTAIIVARNNGYDVNEYNTVEFLNEMRYIQMRDWLIEQFYPPHTFEKRSNKQDMVVDGKVVQFFEITSQNSETLPFNDLDRKKKV